MKDTRPLCWMCVPPHSYSSFHSNMSLPYSIQTPNLCISTGCAHHHGPTDPKISETPMVSEKSETTGRGGSASTNPCIEILRLYPVQPQLDSVQDVPTNNFNMNFCPKCSYMLNIPTNPRETGKYCCRCGYSTVQVIPYGPPMPNNPHLCPNAECESKFWQTQDISRVLNYKHKNNIQYTCNTCKYQWINIERKNIHR